MYRFASYKAKLVQFNIHCTLDKVPLKRPSLFYRHFKATTAENIKQMNTAEVTHGLPRQIGRPKFGNKFSLTKRTKFT